MILCFASPCICFICVCKHIDLWIESVNVCVVIHKQISHAIYMCSALWSSWSMNSEHCLTSRSCEYDIIMMLQLVLLLVARTVWCTFQTFCRLLRTIWVQNGVLSMLKWVDCVGETRMLQLRFVYDSSFFESSLLLLLLLLFLLVLLISSK